MEERRISRRSWLGLAAGATAAMCFPRRAVAQGATSRVVKVVDGLAWNGKGVGDEDIVAERVGAMLAEGLKALTDRKTVEESLGALGLISPVQTGTCAIKVNCVNSSLPTHPAVATGLARLIGEASGGAIGCVVYDRFGWELEKCGYELTQEGDISVLGTDHPSAGYGEAWKKLTHGPVRISNMVSRADHLVSIGVLKNHEMAGVTLSMKNHFGSISDPSVLHGPRRDCTPGVAEVCAVDEIREKSRLWIVDAIFGTCTSGLAGKPEFAPQALLLSTDPVAVDAIGKSMIDEERKRRGLGPTVVRYLEEAERLGLGVAERSGIELVEVELSPPKRFHEGGCSGCSTVPGVALAAGAVAAAGLGLPVGSDRQR